MLTWIGNLCFYCLIELPGNVCRAVPRFASNWWYSHYR